MDDGLLLFVKQRDYLPLCSQRAFDSPIRPAKKVQDG